MTPSPVLTVTCNPAIDVTYRVDRVRMHEVHRVSAVTRRAGGKGLNVASVLNLLGHPVTAAGFIGGHLGDELVDLVPEGVRHAWTRTAVATRSTTAVVDDGGVTLYNEPGEDPGSDAWDRLIAQVEELAPDHRVVVVSGSLPPRAPADGLARIVEAAHGGGACCAVDTSGRALLDAVAAGADLVKPNREELLAATSSASCREGVRELMRLGARTVLLSDGERGMGAYTTAGGSEPVSWVRPASAVQGNATGAGDASVAAVARHLASREDEPDWAEALRDAVALSAATVLVPTAGDFDRDAYAEFRRTAVEEHHAPR